MPTPHQYGTHLQLEIELPYLLRLQLNTNINRAVSLDTVQDTCGMQVSFIRFVYNKLNYMSPLIQRIQVFVFMIGFACPTYAATDCVILLHGLARTSSSMNIIEEAFEQRGFNVVNVDYPSRKYPVETLAPMAIEGGLAACPSEKNVHFITHSLGGILVRYYMQHHTLDRLGRVVMLAPPNQGTEVVDDMRDVPGFETLNGPAGQQLGTDENSIPLSLGPVSFELGVIAGTESINPILSQSLPNPDDGKVSVNNTKVEGMSDFIMVPYTHTFIMRSSEVIDQALHFIETGHFNHGLTK